MDTGTDTLEHYRQNIREGDEESRLEAYREIGDLAIPDGNEILIHGLSDRSRYVRAAVANILFEIADEKITGVLLECLREEDPSIRSQAMSILSRLGWSALRQVEEYLKDADSDVRIFAANIIAAAGHKEAFPALRMALEDPEENVRYAAVEALGRISEEAAIPLLVSILSDEWARYPAIEALGLLKAREAIPVLLELYDKDEWVRNAVIEALGNIGDAGPIGFLVDRVDRDNEMLLHATLAALAKIEHKNPSGAFDRLKGKGMDVSGLLLSALAASNPDIRKSAIWTLGMIGSADDLPYLLEQLSDFDEEIQEISRRSVYNLGLRDIGALLNHIPEDDNLLKELIEIFGEIQNREAIPKILEALEGGSSIIRATAARTLSLFKESSVVDPLILRLNDQNCHVRSASARSLGDLRAVKGTRQLLPLLEDEFEDVRETASEALGKIGTPEIITHVAPLLKHARMEVRQAAVQCLGIITNRRTDSYLIDALNNADRGVRRFAANAIGTRKIISALKPLISSLMDEDWQVRKSAASALGALHDQRSCEPLSDSLKDENLWVRYAAVKALGNVGGEKAGAALRKPLQMDAAPVRIAAMEALSKMKDPDTVSLLISMSEDQDADIRASVAEILGRYISGETVPALLEKMTRDPGAKVRQAAAKALARRE